MGMGIDEAGQHADASEVDLPVRGVAAGIRGADGANDAPVDVHPAVLQRGGRDGRQPAGAVADPGHGPGYATGCRRRLPARLRAG